MFMSMSIFISSKHIWDGQKKDVNNEPEVFLLLLWIMRLYNLHGFDTHSKNDIFCCSKD